MISAPYGKANKDVGAAICRPCCCALIRADDIRPYGKAHEDAEAAIGCFLCFGYFADQAISGKRTNKNALRWA